MYDVVRKVARMIHVDVPIVFSVGALFADAAQEQIRSGSPGAALRAQLQANLFHTLFFYWAPAYFLAAYFGWETSHLWWHGDSLADHPLLLPVLLIVLTLSVNAGFLVGKWLVLRERQRTIRSIYLATATFALGWLPAMGDRVSRLGTYREFVAGVAPRWTDDSTFVFMLGLNLAVTTGALAIYIVRLIREGNRVASSRVA
jgi:hypothetical protein